MSSYYGVTFPEFWTGRTGRELRQRGGTDAQVLGLYLTSNRHANMIGLYRLLVDDITHETGLKMRALDRGFSAIVAADFARFDTASSFVWVRTMARFRLALKQGAALDADDKRVLGVNRMYHALEPNPFLGIFFDANRLLLRLKNRREDVGVVVPFSPDHYRSGLTRGLEGACKPVNRDQRSVNRDQRSD